MYNKCLEYLLDNNSEKVITKTGVVVRKIINPLIRIIIPLTTPTKLKILRRAKIPKSPVIFAATHGFKEDIEDTLITANRQAYILIGSLSQILKSFQGFSAWAAGTILVDRMDKNSRRSAKEKMIRAIQLGSSIIIFPEGTWNKSPNKLTEKLFPGVYDIAKATGVVVVPIATHRKGKYVYSILDEPFDITQYSRENGMAILRDKMSTLRWELIQKYSASSQSNMPPVQDTEIYWENYINMLMSEVKFYDYDVELHTKYVDKNIIEYTEAFAHLSYIVPNSYNAFLFNKRNHN